jgi:hypothetical protein
MEGVLHVINVLPRGRAQGVVCGDDNEQNRKGGREEIGFDKVSFDVNSMVENLYLVDSYTINSQTYRVEIFPDS